MKKNDPRSVLSFTVSLLIVGTIGVFRRYLPLSSPLLAFFRGLAGGGALALFVLLRKKGTGERLPDRKLAGLILNGVFLGVNWILLFEAYNNTTIAKATLCYYLQPTILLLLSPLVFKEKLTAKKMVCAGLSLTGMVFVSGVFDSGASGANELPGILFGLGAACFYTLVVIFNKKLDGIDPYRKTVIQLISAAVALLPYLLLNNDFSGAEFTSKTVLLLLVVCVVHTGVVYALYFGSMDGLQAQTISALSYIDPITAMVVSAVLLKEAPTFGSIAGAVLILGSALACELSLPKKRRDPAKSTEE